MSSAWMKESKEIGSKHRTDSVMCSGAQGPAQELQFLLNQ